MDVKNFGIVLEAETTDCTIEIYLNDIPVGLCGIGGSRKLSRPIHEFLFDGVNKVGVLVNPGDSPATAWQFSRKDIPAFGAQPPPDPALDAFVAFSRDEDRTNREDAAKAKREANGESDPEGEESVKEESTLAFSVNINMYEVGVVAGADDPETLISFSWNSREAEEILREKNPQFPLAEENVVGAQLFPIWLTTEGDVGEMFGKPQWLNAKPQTLDEETIEEVMQFVFFIRDLIEEGDAAPILDISTEMYREVAAAYDISAEERIGLFRKLLEQESEKPYWIFETPEDEDFSLRLCGNNRLIECVGPDWKPVIRGVPSPEGRFLYPMYIGKLDEDWLIMRG